VALALRGATLRPADLVSRYGGEEFALLLPQTPRSGAEHLAHRVLDAVEALGIRHDASPTARHVTVSIGVSCYDEESACWEEPSADSCFASALSCSASDLVQSADTALYASKRGGRAQGWLLDIGQSDSAAREIASSSRPPRGRDTA
jgi:diguanylate cyclase (GGDEF)-like protein